MNIILTKKFVTKRVIRVSLLLTIVLVIWHLTLLKSDAPYINSIASWAMTVVAPFLACTGVHVVVIMYKQWFASKAPGEFAQAGGGDLFLDLSGHSIEGLIATVGLALLFPLVLWALPSGILIGIAYYKHTIWDTITHNLIEFTSKEKMYVGSIALLLTIGISTIVWDLLVIGYYTIVRGFKWAWVK